MRFKRTLTLLKQALAGWWNDQAPSKGAALGILRRRVWR